MVVLLPVLSLLKWVLHSAANVIQWKYKSIHDIALLRMTSYLTQEKSHIFTMNCQLHPVCPVHHCYFSNLISWYSPLCSLSFSCINLIAVLHTSLALVSRALFFFFLQISSWLMVSSSLGLFQILCSQWGLPWQADKNRLFTFVLYSLFLCSIFLCSIHSCLLRIILYLLFMSSH